MTRVLFSFAVLLSLSWACTNSNPPAPVEEEAVVQGTIFLVRHAEKQEGDDPALTEAGQARAQSLARMLEAVQVDAIFSTDYQRTQQTAAPLAEQKALDVQSYDPRKLPEFAEQLRTDYAGKTVVVVGHSNSTPTLTGLIDGTKAHDKFDESDYGNIMLVQLSSNGAAKTHRLRF
ncbi:MAG: phosphoglycerate mutase family protein [Bacteroidota bacterium]